ncbi:hypothetical protein [Nocardia sp. NPDC050710]|uniref:hypothetical protein n=1 Tax=Nocardia sp. NPDC050710 TaxID=3157220 RepID=UPI0033C96836
MASCDRRIAERDRVRLTREEIVGAKFVRTKSRWHEVVRVNSKSVTVRAEVATTLYTFDKIHEVRGVDDQRAQAVRAQGVRSRTLSETGFTVETAADIDHADVAAILRKYGWKRNGDEWTFPRPTSAAQRLAASLDALAAAGIEVAQCTQVNGFDADTGDLHRLAECGYDFALWTSAMWHKQHRNDPNYRSRVQQPGQIWPGDTVRGTYTGRKERRPGPLDIELNCLVIDFGDEVRAVPLLGLEPTPQEHESTRPTKIAAFTLAPDVATERNKIAYRVTR